MNRLVIIGNGFDLAHGLPTRYKDFIENYLCEALMQFYNDYKYEDELITIEYTSSMVYPKDIKVLNYEDAIEKIKHLKSSKRGSFKYNSQFFSKLINNINNVNWVDVENEYFEELKSCKYPNSDKYYFKMVTKLNIEFDYLKKLLEKYLIKIVEKNHNAINPHKYSRLFNDLISKDEVLLKKLDHDVPPNNIHILNFNYTRTVKGSVSQDVNYIHGELKNIDNPLIFGFGDEYDADYKDFENQKNNSLFEHIKSFGYFKTPNYHNLIRFLDSDDYQVYIVGHSCGLSDRTMLKEIFENEKCKSIKIFYYKKSDNTNDYVEKTMEISRHFEDKGLMRKKIVPFPLSKSM